MINAERAMHWPTGGVELTTPFEAGALNAGEDHEDASWGSLRGDWIESHNSITYRPSLGPVPQTPCSN